MKEIIDFWLLIFKLFFFVKLDVWVLILVIYVFFLIKIKMVFLFFCVKDFFEKLFVKRIIYVLGLNYVIMNIKRYNYKERI